MEVAPSRVFGVEEGSISMKMFTFSSRRHAFPAAFELAGTISNTVQWPHYYSFDLNLSFLSAPCYSAIQLLLEDITVKFQF